MRRLFLAQFADMRGKGVIEGLAVDILSMWRQMGLHRSGKVAVGSIGHGYSQAGANLVHESKRQAGAAHITSGPGANATNPQAFLMVIFFSLFCACGVFGSVTVSTPFLK
jgi:hypothetical protein